MSRCFPYPPPGYVRNGSLIESIERESHKTKITEQKEKRREKKEKRKERKEKEKLRKIGEFDEKSPKGEKRKYDVIGGFQPKESEDGTEHLEKSSLTEEHGQAVCSQNMCYLSDDSQSSKKHKWQIAPSNGNQNNGNVTRFKLSLQKHRGPDVSLSKEQVCSTSGREEPLAQPKEVQIPHQEQCCSIKTKSVKHTFEPSKELNCSVFAPNVVETAFGMYENEMKRAESQYKALIEDWVPPSNLQFKIDDLDDQEWLFGTKKQKWPDSRDVGLKGGNHVLWPASATSRPLAQYLPEADIYALPYTIPF
ncbi:hypothetical protein CFOL_v3_00258 [Cephalotus follicularis]|uniref:Uncharacterized protein n=1 Tax=Cephalotus follicularis TaxID=3775 RepID=A0A1Q3ALU3_CEPFO|nr:hypothetical protein CFOL_v3_00258 [Cephalotus follicularis]